MTREELKGIYWNNSTKEACKILGVCQRTLYKYLKENGIPPKRNQNARKKIKIEEK